MINKLKQYIGFGRAEAEWFIELMPDYGIAFMWGNFGFRIGNSIAIDTNYVTPLIPFELMITYPIVSWYGRKSHYLDISYCTKEGWNIYIPYLDLDLNKWDIKSIVIAIQKKIKGEIVPDGFRVIPPNIYIDTRINGDKDESTLET